jgi:hypothetical protein
VDTSPAQHEDDLRRTIGLLWQLANCHWRLAEGFRTGNMQMTALEQMLSEKLYKDLENQRPLGRVENE